MLKLQKNICINLKRLTFIEKKKFKLLLIKKQQQRQTSLNFQSTAPAATNEERTDEAAANKEWQNAKPFEKLPTMNGFTMLKNFLPGGKYSELDTTQLMNAYKNDLGNIALLPGFFGRQDSVLTHNVEDFEKVLRNEGIWPNRPGPDAVYYHRRVYRADFFKGVEGLIGTQGKDWGNFRSAVNPVLMQPKNVKLYMYKMSQVNKELMERIRQIRDPQTLEVPDNFDEELNRWTFESVSVVALNKQLGLITTNRDNPKAKLLFAALNDFFRYLVDTELKPSIWKYYKTSSFKKLMHALDTIVDITSGYINEAIQHIEDERRNGVPEKPDSEKSALEKLIKMDKQIATVMAMDMLMAGVDTTTSTFTGLLLCLAKNPEKQAKLREEVMQILPHKDSEFDENSMTNMPYLRACIKESLRLYPLITSNARIPVNDVVLSGYRVPKGTHVTMIYTSLNTDNDHYPRANEYLPERWLRRPSQDSENTIECPHSLKPSSPFLYLPFGFGARSCVGRRIVDMELELGIARMVRNFQIEFNYPTENAFKSLMINVPNIPLKFKFTDLKN